VYSYEAYDPAPFELREPSDPCLLQGDGHSGMYPTTVSDYFVAHVIRNWELVKADPDWQQDMSNQAEGNSGMCG